MKVLKKLWDSNKIIAWFYDFKQEILISFSYKIHLDFRSENNTLLYIKI